MDRSKFLGPTFLKRVSFFIQSDYTRPNVNIRAFSIIFDVAKTLYTYTKDAYIHFFLNDDNPDPSIPPRPIRFFPSLRLCCFNLSIVVLLQQNFIRQKYQVYYTSVPQFNIVRFCIVQYVLDTFTLFKDLLL